MHPVLATIGPITIYSYGLLLAVAATIGWWVTIRLAQRSGLDTRRWFDYVLLSSLAALLGARLWHMAFAGSSRLEESLSLWGGGLSVFGGVLAAGLALGVVWYRQRQPVAQWFDVTAIGAMLALAVGKVGSFLNGDSYGIPTTVPWGVRFTDPLAPGSAIASTIHPTQLYAAFGYLGAAYLLWRVWRRPHVSGGVAVLGLLWLAIVQALVELWHAPAEALYITEGLRMVPIAAAVTAALAVVLWLALLRRNQRGPQ